MPTPLRSVLWLLMFSLCGLCWLLMPAGAAAAPVAPGEWQCWNDGTLDPCHGSLNGVDLLPDGSGWAVGDGGMIVRVDGATGKWTRVSSPVTDTLMAVSVVSANDAWAVGPGGTAASRMLHWDGQAWRTVNAPGPRGLRSIHMNSATDGWAAGGGFTPTLVQYSLMLHWNGTAWTETKMPVALLDPLIMDVSALPSGEAWAVSNPGRIYRWSGQAWAFAPGCAEGQCHAKAIQMLSASDGWTVGGWTTSDSHGDYYMPEIRRWNGVTWTRYDVPAGRYRLDNLSMSGPDDGWAVGETRDQVRVTLHWDGTAWSIVDAPAFAPTGIDLSAAGSGWGVGAGGWIWRLSGSAWSPYAAPMNRELRAIDMASPYLGWAVGEAGTALLWDGMHWTEQNIDATFSMHDVDAVSQSEAWAVGSRNYSTGGIFRWDGNAWTQVFTSSVELKSISMLHAGGGNATAGWTAGGAGAVYHWPGGDPAGWSSHASPTPSVVSGVAGVSAAEAWVWGVNGIWHWRDGQWTRNFTGNGDWVRDVAFSGSASWAVGTKSGTWNNNDLLLRWDGTAWQREETPATSTLLGIALSGPHAGWAVGSSGTILQLGCTGSGGTCLAGSPVQQSITAVATIGIDAWAVADNGVILHRGPGLQRVFLPLVLGQTSTR